MLTAEMMRDPRDGEAAARATPTRMHGARYASGTGFYLVTGNIIERLGR
jgi:hypothetical protein